MSKFMTKLSIAGPDELFALFNAGNLERHTGATQMNAESSRSHSIFSIMVEAYDSSTKRTNFGKLSIVDLAGSERADKTGASADRLKEAQNINKSLSALGDVIAALSDGVKFIPYRNNKLTQLMQDSLGGNAKTLMFVNFSPADYNADETSTSLTYAARVKKIVNNASKAAESEEVGFFSFLCFCFQKDVHKIYFLLQQSNIHCFPSSVISKKVANLKKIIRKLRAGQHVEDDEGVAVEEAPAGEGQEDKVYDGY